MNIRSSITQVNGKYTVAFALDQEAPGGGITDLERRKLSEYGHFLVNIGGTITPEEGDPLVIDTDERRFPAALPVTRDFAVADYDNAQSLAIAYEAHVLDAISDARTTFLAQESYTSTKVTTLE